VDRYRHGEHWWPDADFEIKHIEPEQRSRREKDAWHGNSSNTGLGIETRFIKREDPHRIHDVLIDLKWKPAKKHTEKGTSWLAPGAPDLAKADDQADDGR
jgi:putative DNA primase/helicase